MDEPIEESTLPTETQPSESTLPTASEATEITVDPALDRPQPGAGSAETEVALGGGAGLSAAQLAEQRSWTELRKLQLETEKVELELAALRRREADSLAEAGRAQVYTFYGSVDADAVQHCLAELGTWSRRDPGAPLTVLFNSPGGSVLDGLALFDYLRQLQAMGHHVTTVALGRAASMGAILLQAGSERVMGENAFLLVHEVSNNSAGKVSEMEDGVDFSRRLQKRLLAILANRSNLTEVQIQRRWARKEWWVDAEEALELGLVDRLL